MKFLFNRQPIAIVGEGKVEGVKVVETRPGAPDAVVAAAPSRSRLRSRCCRPMRWSSPSVSGRARHRGSRAVVSNWTTVAASSPRSRVSSHQTSNPKIFAGGDMVRGSDLVVIRDLRRAPGRRRHHGLPRRLIGADRAPTGSERPDLNQAQR